MNEHLLEALAGIDRPGDIFAAGDRMPAMPGLASVRWDCRFRRARPAP